MQAAPQILKTPTQAYTRSTFALALTKRIQLLNAIGIRPGQRVALMGSAGPEYVLALWSLWQTGVITRPLNPRFPLALLQNLSQDCDWLICPESVAQQLNASVQALPRCLDWRLFDQEIHTDTGLSQTLLPWEHLPLSQPISEILTSGSSGTPKAALHTWGNYFYSAQGSLQHIPINPGDTWLAALPLFHIGGLSIMIRTALAGACAAFPAPDMPLAEALQHFQPSHLSLVATQLFRLLQAPSTIPVLQSCKAILLGGSAIPSSLIEQALIAKLPIHTSYGSTEMSSQICTTRPDASLAELLTAGPVLPGRELKISDQAEIWVRGATRFEGYVAPSGLERPFDAEGWFATGDLGQLTPDGWLQVLGRRDHRFISGGENIQPEAIETALLRHPLLLQAIVVPVSDLEFGQRPVAFIEALKPVSPEAIHISLKAELPTFMLPIAYLDWPQDQNTGLKPSRQNLQILAEQHYKHNLIVQT
jgi:o-succinylbenzoate---CoA ligase